MAKEKRSKKVDDSIKVVISINKFTARTSAHKPMTGARNDGPLVHYIPEGTEGMVHGPAPGIPSLLEVEFDLGSDGWVRVETPSEYVQSL
jgi:hypothetical protein